MAGIYNVLVQSVSVRAVPELIVGGGGGGGRGTAVEFFGKTSSPFCIPVARQC